MIPSASFPPAAEDNTIFISAEPLDIVGLLSKAHHPGAGAVVLFSGEVRNDNNNKQVAFLEYEAQAAIASRMINDILQEASNKWELNIAIAQHRIGKVNICESAVLVITASPHRKEAYDANRFIIDKIKHEVPIWKREYFTDGTNKWGGNCNCNAIT
ncbi:MAG: molybdenum cofactor biosynthesis protein MoaE, partial [Ferruginibacter sp.]